MTPGMSLFQRVLPAIKRYDGEGRWRKERWNGKTWVKECVDRGHCLLPTRSNESSSSLVDPHATVSHFGSTKVLVLMWLAMATVIESE